MLLAFAKNRVVSCLEGNEPRPVVNDRLSAQLFASKTYTFLDKNSSRPVFTRILHRDDALVSFSIRATLISAASEG